MIEEDIIRNTEDIERLNTLLYMNNFSEDSWHNGNIRDAINNKFNKCKNNPLFLNNIIYYHLENIYKIFGMFRNQNIHLSIRFYEHKSAYIYKILIYKFHNPIYLIEDVDGFSNIFKDFFNFLRNSKEKKLIRIINSYSEEILELLA